MAVILNFAQQAADQQRFLADMNRAACPQTMATMGVLTQLPAPQVPSGTTLAEMDSAMGTNDVLRAQQTQQVTQLMMRACSAEAGQGVYPPGFGLQ